MIYNESISDKILRTKKKLRELSILMEKTKKDYQKLLEELSLTSDEISEQLSNPNNFTPPIWEMLQKEKEILDERLERELSQIKDPTKNEKNYSDQATIKQHWLFVR